MLTSTIDAIVHAGFIQVIGVRGGRQSPPFAYTIGRYRNHGEPELLITGVGSPRSGLALHELAEAMEMDPHEDSWTLQESGLKVRTLNATRKRVDKFMLLARAHYGGSDFPALEVVVTADLESAA